MFRRAEVFAVLLSLAGVLAAYGVAGLVFARLPHVEDEMAYVWQAKVYTGGKLTAPTPPDPQSLLVPFVVDDLGQRFAKYPPGWPVLLSLGVRLGLRNWVNPLLAGVALWLIFRLGQKIFDRWIGLLAALLTLTSPLFLINSASLDSEPWSLVLSLAGALAWLDTFGPGRPGRRVPRGLSAAVAGLSLGLLAPTRPLTAIGVALPFFIHGLFLLARGTPQERGRVLLIGALALVVGMLLPLWQYEVTGGLTTDPYTLWWSFDRPGFGAGIGLAPGGHTLWLGLKNAGTMLAEEARDLFGWGNFSWVFLPCGVWAARRKRAAWFPLGIFFSLVAVYIFYWAWVGFFGPRYYYEGLPGLTLASAAGILWLAGKGNPASRRNLLAGLLVLALVCYNLAIYLPRRLQGISGLNGIQRAQLEPFLTPASQAHTPALVIVHVQKGWGDYAGLLELEDPWLTSPFIFARSLDPAADAAVGRDFPNRQVLDYYPDQPGIFYAAPR
jgi:hypothetical protein